MTARWGCLILAMVIVTLLIASLISIRVSGMPLSQDAAGREVLPLDGQD